MAVGVVCHVLDCKFNPNPGVGYCEAPEPAVVLGFVKMGKAPLEPILRCWSYKRDYKRMAKKEEK